MSERTFKITSPLMEGKDIAAWQVWLGEQMELWKVNKRPKPDGIYGVDTRSLTASVCHGLGLSSAMEAMAEGVTPELRIKLRNKTLTKAELARHQEREKDWLPAFRKANEAPKGGGVHTPVTKILQHSWGYHPPVHDGVDLICPWKAPLFAMVKSRVIRVSSGGWWGKGAQGSAAHPVSEGDGIVVLRCLENIGPFRVGMNFGYGHCEGSFRKAGEIVEAGDVIALAGWANAPHIHLVANKRDSDRGVGDFDPWPFVAYAVANQ